MSKREAKKLMSNSNLIDKKVYYRKFYFIFFIFFIFFFLLYIKMDNTTYYQRKRDVALNQAK